VIQVNNVAPTIDVGGDRTAYSGQSMQFQAVIADPGLEDTHEVVWDFGDGAPAASGLEVSHTFDSPGSYAVEVTVEDDDGGRGQASLTVEVREAHAVHWPLLLR
jgi:PKD repeat protein